MKIIILTANEYRHKFFRKYLNNNKNLKVSLVICENKDGRQSYQIINSKKSSSIQKKHFIDRKKHELKFFSKYIKNLREPKNKLIVERGEINKNINLIKKISSIKGNRVEVYGENTNFSNDSHDFGLINKASIKGKVTSRISTNLISSLKFMFNPKQ